MNIRNHTSTFVLVFSSPSTPKTIHKSLQGEENYPQSRNNTVLPTFLHHRWHQHTLFKKGMAQSSNKQVLQQLSSHKDGEKAYTNYKLQTSGHSCMSSGVKESKYRQKQCESVENLEVKQNLYTSRSHIHFCNKKNMFLVVLISIRSNQSKNEMPFFIATYVCSFLESTVTQNCLKKSEKRDMK